MCSCRLSRRASACMNRLPCGDVRITVSGVPRAAFIVSSARKIGSGFNTIPGPPPYGTSSTTRCRSVVKSRRSCTSTSSVPHAIARPRMPAASGSRIIAGKMVTISNVKRHSGPEAKGPAARVSSVQIQQTFRRIDYDPLRRDVNRGADCPGQRHLHLSAWSRDHETTPLERPLDVADDTDVLTRSRFHATPDQLVPVKRLGRQRRKPIDRNSQLGAGKRLRLGHRRHAVDPHDRPFLLKADRRQAQPLDPAGSLDEQLGAGLETGLGKIGVEIDDHLPSNAVRTRDASDQGHLVPVHAISGHRILHSRSTTINAKAAQAANQPSRISNVTSLPSRSPAVAASVRSAAAVRPWRPITLPRSPGETNSSIKVLCRCCDSVTRTSSGRSVSTFARSSTTARTPVPSFTCRPLTWPPAPGRA